MLYVYYINNFKQYTRNKFHCKTNSDSYTVRDMFPKISSLYSK